MTFIKHHLEHGGGVNGGGMGLTGGGKIGLGLYILERLHILI